MDPQAFKEQWRSWYGDVPPVGHILRHHRADVWMRIHSLPGSKRYPDTQAEWTELLARHNAVATALLGEGNPCVLVTPRFGEHGEQLPRRLESTQHRSSGRAGHTTPS